MSFSFGGSLSQDSRNKKAKKRKLDDRDRGLGAFVEGLSPPSGAAQTGRLVNNRHLFPAALETGKSKSKAQVLSGEGSLPGSQPTPEGLLTGPHLEAGVGGALWGSFAKGASPVVMALPLRPSHVPKPPPTNTIPSGGQHCTCECGGHTHSVHSRTCRGISLCGTTGMEG